ncbi:MAG: fatty acyl-AMP ligase [Cyanobacteria bacterium J06649_5]
MTTTLSVSSQTVPSAMNLVALLEYRAQHQPQRLAYQYLRRGEQVEAQLTYQELRDRAFTIAHRLRELGISGGRALLLFSPGLEFVSAFLGCLQAGVTAVPAYPPRKNQKMLRLQSIVSDAEATAVLTTSDLAEKLGRWFDTSSPLAAMDWVSVDALEADADRLSFDNSSLADAPNNPLAFLQYTSGSTGNPKGVMVSQDNLMHNLDAIYRCFGHSPSSKGMIWLPPYHDMGLIGGVLQPLYGGFPVSLMSPIDFLQKPLRWLKAISQYGATTSGGPDFAYALCARKAQALLAKEGEHALSDLDLSRWTVAFIGAEPIRTETLRLFVSVFEPYGFCPEAFYPCYGMAETTLIVSGGEVTDLPVIKTLDAEALAHHQASVIQEDVVQENILPKKGIQAGVINNIAADVSTTKGTAEKSTAAKSTAAKITVEPTQTVVGCGKRLFDQTIEIVDPHTAMRCSPGSVGEVWVSGKSVTIGYWNNPEETQRTYRAYLADTGEGPFLRTGDLGFLLEEELFITGRLKDMMIIRGQNHYPQDIEHTVEGSHPALRAGGIAAFSVEAKGEEQLVIISEIERTHIRQINVQAVASSLRQAIAAAHNLQVHAILLIKPGSMPKTSSGKIQRYRCKQLFLTGGFCVVKDWSENPRHKSEFLNIQSEMNSVLVTIDKQYKNRGQNSPKNGQKAALNSGPKETP